MTDTHDNRTVTPPPQPTTLKDTPARPRSVHTSDFRGASLQSKRDALLRELDCIIPEYDIKQFLGLLPRTNIDFDDIIEQLVDEGVILEVPPDAGDSPDSKKFRLAHFPIDPKNCSETENVLFNRLNENVFKGMVDAVSQKHPTDRPTTQLRTDPNTAPESIRLNKTKPDAHFVLDGKIINGKKCNWADISCTGEFKEADSIAARDDNVTKMVYNLHHTMSIDPCRRFTFGFTIENTRMRLWFLSRSVLAVSTSFDFIRDPETFFRFFLSMTYGKKTELGWDETVTRVEGMDWRYEMQCAGEKYRVLEVLADYGADVMTGRGTRVYKAQHVTETGELGEISVLKDVYINDDRKTDDEIYDEIMASVTDEEDCRYLKEHLLEPSEHWLVTVDGVEDHTVKVMMHGIPTKTSRFFRLVAKEPEDYDPARVSAAPRFSFEYDQRAHISTRYPSNKRDIVGRKHYRVVFKQVATPIWQLTTLSDVFLVLRDGAKTLKILAKYSWVHRDISAGNVHYHNGKGLLGDLEYAKMLGTASAHDDVLTGTQDFMAAEILKQGYSVQPELDLDNIETYDAVDAGFEHNSCHDVESLFWLAVFMLFFNKDVSSAKETHEVSEERRKCSKFVFPDSVVESALHRISIIFLEQNFKTHLRWFCSSFQPFIDPLYTFNKALCVVYTKYERTMATKKDAGILLLAHDRAISTFETCMAKSTDITIEPNGTRPMFTPQPQPEHQPNSQPEPKAGDPKPNLSESANQRPPVLNAGDRKRKAPPEAYVIENLPRYTDKKICLDRTR